MAAAPRLARPTCPPRLSWRRPQSRLTGHSRAAGGLSQLADMVG
ncbi:hypothetical protein I545_5585 [Mycobacterium kansasii 662]|uniref:Uncharacterized protein n=2 Tax=Mycobacterium kansasii TaxID=1768 RepID=A0A1V3XCW0_MYCKA|nr:hypothetical protein I545_5585 [Mycobacterium kansasii 662]OOK66623.1 hypothetical protein BZL30_8290 [Mycobacterium kansasii]OOK77053.1 hypothetical protein BZL29_3202 [Mycobacterium kansasii]